MDMIFIIVSHVALVRPLPFLPSSFGMCPFAIVLFLLFHPGRKVNRVPRFLKSTGNMAVCEIYITYALAIFLWLLSGLRVMDLSFVFALSLLLFAYEYLPILIYWPPSFFLLLFGIRPFSCMGGGSASALIYQFSTVLRLRAIMFWSRLFASHFPWDMSIRHCFIFASPSLGGKSTWAYVLTLIGNMALYGMYPSNIIFYSSMFVGGFTYFRFVLSSQTAPSAFSILYF